MNRLTCLAAVLVALTLISAVSPVGSAVTLKHIWASLNFTYEITYGCEVHRADIERATLLWSRWIQFSTWTETNDDGRVVFICFDDRTYVPPPWGRPGTIALTIMGWPETDPGHHGFPDHAQIQFAAPAFWYGRGVLVGSHELGHVYGFDDGAGGIMGGGWGLPDCPTREEVNLIRVAYGIPAIDP